MEWMAYRWEFGSCPVGHIEDRSERPLIARPDRRATRREATPRNTTAPRAATDHAAQGVNPALAQAATALHERRSNASREVASSCAQRWGRVKKPNSPPYAWPGFEGSDRPRAPRRQGIVAPLGKHIILYPTSGAESVAAGTRRGTVLVYVNPQYVLPVSPDVSATGPNPLVPADSHAHSLLLGSRFA